MSASSFFLRRTFAFLILFLAAALTLSAQPQRPPDKKAIVIGINCYDPNYPDCAKLKNVQPTSRVKRDGTSTGDWRYWQYGNLEGAVNDAAMMKSILEADPHKFEIPDDAYLTDEKATADAILFALRKYLITDAREGDLRVVYYSGHGNYVRNTAVADPKDFDETMVPSDHWRGTPDIRDKELSRIFAEAGKKVRVVFIADSCHSGSLTRGARLKRALEGSADDPKAPKVEDKPSAVDPMKAPYGLVFLSAARRDQPAVETEGKSDDVSDPFTGPHGAFTWALKRAFDGYGSSPVDVVFSRAASFLELDNPYQIPNIEGLQRGRMNLFGEPIAVADGGSRSIQTATVDSVSENGEIRLRGGPAVGIYLGTELTRVSRGAGGRIDLRVTKEDGLAFSVAKVIEPGNGSAKVQKGEIFQVEKWVVPSESSLGVYLPPTISVAALTAAAVEFAKLQSGMGANWIQDETDQVPTHILQWNGRVWALSKDSPPGPAVELGTAPAASEITKHLPPDAKLLLVMPPSQELENALPFVKAATPGIRVFKTVAGAHYWLRGRLRGSTVEYAWVRPEASISALRSSVATSPLPVRSNWIASDPSSTANAAADIADKAGRLGRIRVWLMLRPAGPAKEAFPYSLAFREVGSDRFLSSPEVIGGKEYKLYLRASPAALKALHNAVVPRYTYVFAIDQFGNRTLLFPAFGAGNQDNLFPVPVAKGEATPPAPELIPVSGAQTTSDIAVDAPYGTDTYFLLTSLERLDNPDVLQAEGVRSRGATWQNPLTELLNDVGSTSRGAVPANWSIERVQLRSKDPNK